MREEEEEEKEEEEEEKNILSVWRLAIWFGTFTMLFHATRRLVGNENT